MLNTDGGPSRRSFLHGIGAGGVAAFGLTPRAVTARAALRPPSQPFFAS
jgi:hypothetical protein